MTKKIQKIILTSLEYLPIILTVFFGALFVFKGQEKEISIEKQLNWVVTLLCLLATSILFDRFSKLRRIENQTKELGVQLKKINSDSMSVDNILLTRKTLPPLEKRLQTSKEVFITGGSLIRLSNEYLGLFENLAKEGCVIKLLLLNPNAPSAKLTADNIVYEIDDFETYQNYIKSSLKSFTKLSKKYPNSIEIKISDFLPSYSFFGVDLSKDYGSIMVEIYTFNEPTRERPHFNLSKMNDPVWFNYFLNQFDKIWEISDSVNS